MFTVYNCSVEFFGFSYFLSNVAFNILKSGQQVKQVNVCIGFTLFVLRTVLLPAVSIIFVTVHSH